MACLPSDIIKCQRLIGRIQQGYRVSHIIHWRMSLVQERLSRLEQELIARIHRLQGLKRSHRK